MRTTRAARRARRAGPHPCRGLRSGRTPGFLPGLCRTGDVAGYMVGRADGIPPREPPRPRDACGSDFAARVPLGRASPHRPVRRCALRRIAPGALDPALSRRHGCRRSQPGAGRAGRPLGHAVGLLRRVGRAAVTLGCQPYAGHSRGRALRRDRLCCVGPNGQRAIRTPAWYLRATDGRNSTPSPTTVGRPTTSPRVAWRWSSVSRTPWRSSSGPCSRVPRRTCRRSATCC